MILSSVWIAGYGGPPSGVVGATPVWIAPNDGSVPGVTEILIVGYFTAVSGASPIWIAGYGSSPPAAIGAVPVHPNWGQSSGGGGSTHSPQALAYLARTVGGNEGGNGENIANLIDGLVSDGVWAKLDALYVLAQQNAADSLLNLVETSYPLIQFASPQFTAYVGYNFPTNSALDTGFDAASAPSPKYTQNSASYGVWSLAVVDENYAVMGNGAGAGGFSVMYPSFPSASFYARVNDGGGGSIPTPGTKGLFVGDRSSSANVNPYWNGVSQGTIASISQGVANANFSVGQSQGYSAEDAPAPRAGTQQVLCAAFVGASLGSSGQLALYNRLRTYMTAVAP